MLITSTEPEHRLSVKGLIKVIITYRKNGFTKEYVTSDISHIQKSLQNMDYPRVRDI
jgi:hypothetical protein